MAKATGKALKIDFTGTEERKGGRHYKAGDYAVKVKSAEAGKSKQKETPQIVFTYVFSEKPYKGKEIYHRCNLLPQSLWVLRNALEAMGLKVPSKAVNIDLAKLKGKELGISVEDDEYDNKTVSKVVDTFPIDDLEARQAGTDDDLDDDDEETDDEDGDDDEDEDDDDDKDEDLEEIDLDEL